MIERVAPSPVSTILLTGESGTGKDVVAHAIHADEPASSTSLRQHHVLRAPGKLCSRVSSSVMKPARSRAQHDRRRGSLELADGGTVFLDEIARDDACPTSEAPPLHRGTRISERRRNPRRPRRRSRRRRHEPRPTRRGRRPVDSVKTSTIGCASSRFTCRPLRERTGRHRAARRAFHHGLQATLRPTYRRARTLGARATPRACLARQRSRAEAHARAGRPARPTVRCSRGRRLRR